MSYVAPSVDPASPTMSVGDDVRSDPDEPEMEPPVVDTTAWVRIPDKWWHFVSGITEPSTVVVDFLAQSQLELIRQLLEVEQEAWEYGMSERQLRHWMGELSKTAVSAHGNHRVTVD